MDKRNIASPLRRLANKNKLYSQFKKKYFTRRNARVDPNVRENHYGPNYNTLKKANNPREGPVPIQSLNLIFKRRNNNFDVDIGNQKRRGVDINKGTSNNAKRIFKQNFKQKIIKESVTIVVSYATGNKESFYEGTWWKEIQARLKNENCTKTEAIYLYDLLITTFIVSFLTGILNIHGYKYSSNYLSRNIDNLYLDLNFLGSVFFFNTLLGTPSTTIGAIILFAATNPIAGGALIGIFALIAVTSFTGYSIRKRINNQMSDKIFELSHEILKCMFNDDNKIKIAELKDTLYFWFFSKKCIDYIFDVGLGKIKEANTSVAEPITIDRNNNNTAPDCGICLNKLNNGTKIKTLLLCGHKFHDTCIENWFKESRKRECPLCRVKDISVYHGKLPVNKNFDEMVGNYKGQFRNFLNNMREILFFEIYDIAPVEEFSDEVIKYAYTQYDTYNKSTLNEINIPKPERPTNNSDENAKLAYKNAVLKYGEEINKRSTSRSNRASNKHLFSRNKVNAEALAGLAQIEEVPERLEALVPPELQDLLPQPQREGNDLDDAPRLGRLVLRAHPDFPGLFLPHHRRGNDLDDAPERIGGYRKKITRKNKKMY